MKTFTAFTYEIDDVELAVSEILEQLNLDALGKNSVGIISCYSEFVDTGVVEALCEKLPFEVAGITTIENAVQGEISDMMLTLMVLTDDSISFSVGLSAPILSSDEKLINELYESAANGHGGKPSLIISFGPILMNVSADFYVESMDKISGNIPNFGTLAMDHTSDYHTAAVIHGGKAYSDRYAIILVYGDVKPEFFVGTVSKEKVFREKGVITSSRGNQIETVNGMSATDYLLTIGLTKDDNGSVAGINTFPFIIDYNDGSEPVVRAVYAMSEDGCAVCGGDVPIGATLSVGSIDGAEVLATSEDAIKRALGIGKSQGMLIFSCVGRYFAQGFAPTGEAELIDKHVNGSAPYFFASSGGELCPVRGKDGTMKNRNHNDTIIICTFAG